MATPAKRIVQQRDAGPIISWIRAKLNKTTRIGGWTDAEYYKYNHRSLDEQTPRDQPPPHIPGGVNHKLATNYYLTRDGRRAVEVPLVVARDPAVSNTGATPGQPYVWKRNTTDETDKIKYDPIYTNL